MKAWEFVRRKKENVSKNIWKRDKNKLKKRILKDGEEEIVWEKKELIWKERKRENKRLRNKV